MFVIDFTDQLLDEVLQRHEPVDSAVFIGDKRNVLSLGAQSGGRRYIMSLRQGAMAAQEIESRG